MDELIAAKKSLLVELLRVPDDEKSDSERELEAILTNEPDLAGCFEPEHPYAELLAMFERMATFLRR